MPKKVVSWEMRFSPLDAFGKPVAGLSDDAVDGATAMPAANLGIMQESAGVIAAFGDFDVGEMRRGEAETRVS